MGEGRTACGHTAAMPAPRTWKQEIKGHTGSATRLRPYMEQLVYSLNSLSLKWNSHGKRRRLKETKRDRACSFFIQEVRPNHRSYGYAGTPLVNVSSQSLSES